MVHIFVAYEGPKNSLDAFESWIKSRQYKNPDPNNPNDLQINNFNQIRLADIRLHKEILDQVLEDLFQFERPCDAIPGDKSIAAKIIRKVFHLKPVKFKPTEHRISRNGHNWPAFIKVFVIGIREDLYSPAGQELV
ncbi:MAG: hypothetical protein DRP11_00110 [Candidatus Aenigmatarchaeota archaeon]|nr:MAG: hypothetical protein DRP11_00110 [Candidatus Aenigmarchaeota archaeon]